MSPWVSQLGILIILPLDKLRTKSGTNYYSCEECYPGPRRLCRGAQGDDLWHICDIYIYIKYIYIYIFVRGRENAPDDIFLCWWCLVLSFNKKTGFFFIFRSLDTVSHLIRIYALINAWQKSSQWSMSWKVLHHPFWTATGPLRWCHGLSWDWRTGAVAWGNPSLRAYWLPFRRCFSKSFLGKMRSTWFLFGAFGDWLNRLIGFDVDTTRMGVDKIWDYICTYRLERVE